MRHAVSHKIAIGAMNLIANGAGSADFTAFQLSDEDYGLLTGNKQWVAGDRSIIDRVMTVLLFGIMDIIGVDRFRLSTEYKAAAIAIFVQPQNTMVACAWCADLAANASLVNGEKPLEADKGKPEELFGLVLMCMEPNPVEFRTRFEQRTGLEVLTEE